MPLALLLLACAPTDPGKPGAGEPGPDTAAVEDTGDPTPRAALQLALPLLERDRFTTVVGKDDDPVEQEDSLLGRITCTDHQGRSFPHCYDEHEGTDYILRGGFDAMDAGSATVHAAAPGTVIRTVDGNYDRCHGSLETGDVDCDGHEMKANKVVVEHATGHTTHYLHLQSGSVSVEEGQAVQTGDVLGRVGSSGRSSMPHLHLTLEDADGVRIDPYAGAYSQPETFWCEQVAADGLPGPCEETP
jgi:murein DD-endopeptidase MepM/ murein hydrolase activator NlpD